MATTEVILTSSVPGLGAESDKVKVKAGYARNYLLPNRKAIRLTESNERRLEALRKRRAERESTELRTMQELAASLARISLKLVVKTGDDGRMFGSVTGGDIVAELEKQLAVHLDRRKVHLDAPLKALGEHDVELRLHAKVHATLKVIIESSTPLPPPPAADAAAPEAPAETERPRRGYRPR
ncbi:MAG: 50S ribosomal protein L9 [Verrucomicrobiales bacterium]|nr:50S ribosomal protein L9 [Verrucomicrobiales bacterium]